MKISNIPQSALVGLGAVALLVGSAAAFQSFSVTSRLKNFEEAKQAEATDVNFKITALEEAVVRLTEENNELKDDLASAEKKSTSVEKKLSRVSGTVGTLEKLQNTDEELLQKYSKVYFLNEHYVPSDLTAIKTDYLNNKARITSIHSDVAKYLDDMIEESIEDGVNLRVVSAYRSFDEQSSLKSAYKVTYGAGTANQFSADQGYSEHQLGTAVDLTTAALGNGYERFDSDPAYAWMKENAYKFGFILSYPPGNTYYTFEPWHWRFVGKDLAKYLHDEGKGFYDLDQREIDKYLVNIF